MGPFAVVEAGEYAAIKWPEDTVERDKARRMIFATAAIVYSGYAQWKNNAELTVMCLNYMYGVWECR